MAARYRVALHGFSDFERTALTFCFKHAGARTPGYVQVELLADSDFIVADARHAALEGSVTRAERMRDTLFIGDDAPLGASAQLRRPLDPERILRALDAMAALRGIPKPLAARLAAPRAAPGGSARQAHRSLPEGASDTVSDTAPNSASNPAPDTVPDAMLDIALPLLTTAVVHFNNRDVVDTTPAAFRHEPETSDFAAPAAPVAITAPEAPDPAPPTPKPAGPGAAERALAKARARSASRRARMLHADVQAADALRDVLVFDGASEPSALGAVLEAFGFQVHRAATSAQAESLLAQWPMAAAFLDAAPREPDDLDGIELCLQIKQRVLPLAGAVPPVMLVASGDSAAGRVRAKLAGCDAVLIRPVSRGAAARALEACNVALPADARQTE